MLVLRTHFDSINTRFLQEFLYKNMIWIVGYVRVFLCNYVLYSFGLILNYIFRFQVGGDRKTESDQFHQDSEIDGFREELANFLFQSYEDVFEDGGESEATTEISDSIEIQSDSDENEGREGETESSVLMEVQGKTDCSVSMEVYSDFHENVEKEGETKNSVLVEVHSELQESEEKDKETEYSVLMEVHENSCEARKKSEGETECFISMKTNSDFHKDIEKEGESTSSDSMEVHFDSQEKENEKKQEVETDCSDLRAEEKSSKLMEDDSEISTRKYEYVSGRNISGFMDEPKTMSFTFREFYVGPNVPAISDNNAFSTPEIIAQKKESSKKEQESVQENEFLSHNTTLEALEPEEPGKSEGNDEKEGSKKTENEKEEWKKMLEELECDEELEGDFEWEHDDIVKQLKMELRNARQGGLSTIAEEEEEEEEEEEKTEETEYPEDFEDQKLQKIEEKMEFEDQMEEIQEGYQSYEEKMKRLDILNYQTMHGLGLLQLKDPLKSSIPNMKPMMSWGRKEAKSPIMKFVEELERDLELVYVGQICLSWEILCWQHKKALKLKHYHYHSHYNIAAGEFQLFQVLLQRFIENEIFQGPRTHNFVKNRCVIRNLLQVPPIRDDESSMEEKMNNMVKGEEVENAVCSGRLAEIIKESMWLFWKFVRADKENGHFILRTLSHQTTPSDLKDPSLSDLLKHIKAHLHKKERKLKDIVRTGNCIVRKLQKQHEHEQQLNHEQLLAQVGLKLVSRVLNLSKLRKDHLLWCNEKLNRIKFVKKKVLVEPSFLLFPC